MEFHRPCQLFSGRCSKSGKYLELVVWPLKAAVCKFVVKLRLLYYQRESRKTYLCQKLEFFLGICWFLTEAATVKAISQRRNIWLSTLGLSNKRFKDVEWDTPKNACKVSGWRGPCKPLWSCPPQYWTYCKVLILRTLIGDERKFWNTT